MAEMIYANDLKQAMKDAGQFDYVKAEVVYKSAWGVPIVDAEEVVRCKDCKHLWRYIECDTHKINLTLWMCKKDHNPNGEDFYCGDGERKDEVEE